MGLAVLTVNAGSSSLKLRLLGVDDEVLATHTLENWDGTLDPSALAAFGDTLGGADAVGHRVVHGGTELREPTLIDGAVAAQLQALVPLAPLHQPRSLAAIHAVARLVPDVPAVACFDTAFHATLPAAAATYALPQQWRDRWPLRRYGFHGLSHQYAARRAADLLDRPLQGQRIITCHLGAGASLCAVRDGSSVDTTMGFTPLEGLVMATRSGSVDPGLVLWLLSQAGLTPDEVLQGLEQSSGLAGLSGTSGDLRQLRPAAAAGDVRAVLALDVYLHRLRREIAAMTAALNGLDTLVFTGGVGEHDPLVRASAAEGLGHLGIEVDEHRNAAATDDCEISGRNARVRTVVVAAREDLEIARQVRAVAG